jgi:hypothetical protein
MCPGCILEAARQRKTYVVESEMMEANTANNILVPMLEYITTPVSIKILRKNLQHLPTLQQHKRDDSIFGVIRYIANSLGFRLNNATAGSIDEPMSLLQAREKWRQATFICKCCSIEENRTKHGNRAFCTDCAFLVPYNDPPAEICCGCLLQNQSGPTSPLCLACQFATVIHRNRFHERYVKYIEQWLPTLASESEDDTVDPRTPTQRQQPFSQTRVSYQDLQKLRQRSLRNSFSEIRARSSPAENIKVIENIIMIQRDIRGDGASSKRSIHSLQSNSLSTTDYTNDENYSTRDAKTIKKVLFDDAATHSSASQSLETTMLRQPLAPIDINSITSEKTSLSRKQQKYHNRTLAAKAKRKERAS